ncbi:hypothetical protein [Streptomyces sp. NPDC058872]|uniref:hypothetical protein n=1 Tax=Streptomyces sp. NPDC058872 TaxID=3346661 RepID=UPI003685389B
MNVGPALLLTLAPDGGFVPVRGMALPALGVIATLALPAVLLLPHGTDREGTRPEPTTPGTGRRPCVRS